MKVGVNHVKMIMFYSKNNQILCIILFLFIIKPFKVLIIGFLKLQSCVVCKFDLKAALTLLYV